MNRLPFLFFLLLIFSLQINAQQKIEGKSKVKQIQFKKTVNQQGVRYRAKLELSNILFTEDNGNGVLDAGENSFVSFTLSNNGEGEATDVAVVLEPKRNKTESISYDKQISIGYVYPGQSTQVYIPIAALNDLEDGTSVFLIKIIEKNGFTPSPEPIAIETQSFKAPEVLVADALFSTKNGKPAEVNFPVYVKALVQNVGEGVAENVVAEFVLPKENCLALSQKFQNIGTLRKGESKEIKFSFVATQNYDVESVPVGITLTESNGKYAQNRDLTVSFGDQLLATNYSSSENKEDESVQIASLTPEVDKNIPESKNLYQKRIALIIGNEDYHSKQASETNEEVNVKYARNDARIFREYAKKSLGIDEKNIFFLMDATAAEMNEAIQLVSKLAMTMGHGAEIVFYYAGHGLPDVASRAPYIVPVDVSGTNLTSAIAMKDVYGRLGNSGANKVTVILDACFSGGGRTSGLVASRGIRVKPKDELLPGNIVVFSASSEQQTALPYEDKQHGMFTYFLLKALQDTKGELSYGQLSEYLSQSVAVESLRVNKKEQVPQVNFSDGVAESWMEWEIR